MILQAGEQEIMTILLQLVHQSRLLKSANILSPLCGLILLFNFTYWSAACYGFDSGYSLADTVEKIASNFETDCVDGLCIGIYKQLSIEYSNLTYYLIGFVLISLIRRHIVNPNDIDYWHLILPLLNFILLVVSRMSLIRMHSIRIPDLSVLESSYGSYRNISIAASNFDWISIWVIALVIAIEIAILSFFILRLLKNRKEEKLNGK
jgi:hypothetical protein